MQVEGNVAIVTGGASGLGEATARHLHARGAKVVIFDRDAERGPAIAAELADGAVYPTLSSCSPTRSISMSSAPSTRCVCRRLR